MRIQNLIKRLVFENETYYLEKKEKNAGTDDLGYPKEEWVEVKELTGIIQKESIDPHSPRGSEEVADYYGFFVADFKIPQDNLLRYRIKHVITVNEEENQEQAQFVRYFRIKTIDRDLRRKNKRNHYEMTLELYKKW
ncbi:MAG: hypothetical protein AB7D08_03585 [Bacteroidales bacterium]|jgi:hypothetical protein